jgi:hypothetical protein
MITWTWAAASRRGTSHERSGTHRQDAYRCLCTGRSRATLVAIACDGAGSASHGRYGASLASRTLTQRAHAHCKKTRRLPQDGTIQEWIDEVRDRIAVVARQRQLALRDFATTVVMAVSNAKETVTLHIGDGAVVCRSARDMTWEALSWPEHGEYASTTFFLTDDSSPRVRISRRQSAIDRLALFTDGIERLALNFADNTPHAPFFSAMSGPVAQSARRGFDPELSAFLGAYLSSDAINARTDDDKTLILASAA